MMRVGLSCATDSAATRELADNRENRATTDFNADADIKLSSYRLPSPISTMVHKRSKLSLTSALDGIQNLSTCWETGPPARSPSALTLAVRRLYAHPATVPMKLILICTGLALH